MDMLIRERNGKEERWYSEDYIKEQIQLAHQSGIHRGLRVEFHAVTPMDDKQVDDLTKEFNRRVEEEYQKYFKDLIKVK